MKQIARRKRKWPSEAMGCVVVSDRPQTTSLIHMGQWQQGCLGGGILHAGQTTGRRNNNEPKIEYANPKVGSGPT
jgi:hypothetical protein